MEVPEMDEAKKAESHMSSPAAFVEGGIQEACDDACSICLEGFCDSDPSTVTSCNHEFHLQCVLEWCQRSSNCPMCWQNISLKNPTSQELLEAVKREMSVRFTPSQSTRIFRHPTLGDFELQHLPEGVNDAELEERIIQHLAAAAAMGRTHRVSRREGPRSRSSAHARSQFMVYSAHPNGSSTGSGGQETDATALTENYLTVNSGGTRHMHPSNFQGNDNQISSSSSGTGRGLSDDDRNHVSEPSLTNQDRAGPSELHSFSDTWKSRFNSISVKYKESISKSTKEWKEKLFSRSSTMADIGSEVKREVNAGIASVSRMMERLEARDNNNNNNNRGVQVVQANSSVTSPVTGRKNNNRDTPDDVSFNGNSSASFAANSVSS